MKQIYDNKDIGDTIDKSFDAGIKEGYRRCKEQMLNEAVEGEITKDNRGNNVLRVGLFNNGFEIGDKVRVIVLPQGKLIWRAKDE